MDLLSSETDNNYDDGTNDNDDQGSVGDVQIEPHELIKTLKKIWMNEKFAPEILQHRSDVVFCVLEELKRMEQELLGKEKGDLEVSIRKMEVERLRYIVSDYLRIRLNKIEKFCFNLLEQEETRQRAGLTTKLAENEFAYLSKYRKNIEDHLNKSALNGMPANAKNLKVDKIAAQPNFDQFVFLRVEQDKDVKDVNVQNPIEIGHEENVDLEAGSQHVLPYKSVVKHLYDNDLRLV